MRHNWGFAALFSICLGLTLLDIFVVEGFFRPAEAWGEIWKYHIGFYGLIVALPIASAYFTKSLLPLGAWIFFVFGLEDTLFYGLQGYLPEVYMGVYVTGFWEPSLASMLTLNLVGIITLASYVIAIYNLRVLKTKTDDDKEIYETKLYGSAMGIDIEVKLTSKDDTLLDTFERLTVWDIKINDTQQTKLAVEEAL